ncbi:uncharacterized protein LOC129739307 [Uranotaenia lowii]|uniref:uncharacterized protein LOC129739307 n=1 Tax=Uranotaenia lowii TaxID=190385 RepID=UPI00247A651F|nr:uncharacterized protein LOC129739307 [Uranotaenia lowii]
MLPRTIIMCLAVVYLINISIGAPIDQRSQLLASIQEIQRKYGGRSSDDDSMAAVEKETPSSDDKPEVDVDNIENAEPTNAENPETEDESSRQAKVLKTRQGQDSAGQGTKRKNKMFGFYGYFPQPTYQQPLAYPSYYPLEYYDDYSALEGYSNNPFANIQNYQQNMAALQSMAAIQSLNNIPSTSLPNLANLDNNQALQDYQNLGPYSNGDNLPNIDDEDILSRNNQRRRPANKNSPIYYIRLPPTPYMFVPGLGYISQPPTIQPLAPAVPQYPQLAPPVTMSPFYNLPINFVSNGKPSGIYQWGGAPSPAPMPQPAYALPYPAVRPSPIGPVRPAFRPNPFVTDSKITHLKGPFLFNGRPEEIFLLQNSINPFLQSPLNPINPFNGYY